MNAMANPYEKYKQHGVMTASPAELIVILYDECIKQLKLSCLAMQENNYEHINLRTQKAQQVIMELINSLDLHFPLGKDLLDIYGFLLRQIIEANTRKEKKLIEPLIDILSSLREAWIQVAKANRNTTF
ncbi:MAG: flagellar export chaperone FliS [Christensenellales bacterium]